MVYPLVRLPQEVDAPVAPVIRKKPAKWPVDIVSGINRNKMAKESNLQANDSRVERARRTPPEGKLLDGRGSSIGPAES
jgi:hypothetical protein